MYRIQYLPVLWISNTLMRIRISFFALMWIRVRLLAVMLTRIRLFNFYADPDPEHASSWLFFGAPKPHFELLSPIFSVRDTSWRNFEPPQMLNFDLMRIRIRICNELFTLI
jgi:hypothetical protein